jgi:hypothetical protein
VKVWMIVLPTLAVLVIGGLIAAYLLVAPPKLADDYEKKAEPEQAKVEEAVRPVADSFNADVFGTLPISSKLSPRAYLRKYRKNATRDKRELARAGRAVRKAKRALAEVDGDAMTDAPSWPLLGGDLDEAEEVAGMQEVYLRKARAFVKDYEELVEYEQFLGDVYDRLNISDAEGQASVPANPTSPGQITDPLGRVLRTAQAQLRRMQKRKPPKALKVEHRRAVAEVRKGIADNRALMAAINRRDIGRINALA